MAPRLRDAMAATPSLPLRADAGRPLDRCAAADLSSRKLGADLAQVVGEQEVGARTIGAVDRSDRQIGKLEIRVQRLDRLIVPVRDLAQIDARQRRAVERATGRA